MPNRRWQMAYVSLPFPSIGWPDVWPRSGYTRAPEVNSSVRSIRGGVSDMFRRLGVRREVRCWRMCLHGHEVAAGTWDVGFNIDNVGVDEQEDSEFGDVHAPFFFSSRRRHTRCSRDWSSDVCSSD